MVRKILLLAVLWLGGTGWLGADTLLILDSREEKSLLQSQYRKLTEFLKQNSDRERGNEAALDKIRIRQKGKEYLLTIGPLPSDTKMASLYFHLKKLFPEAVAIETAAKRTGRVKIPMLPKGGADGRIQKSSEERSVWIALFALALTGILALFVSSLKLQRLGEQYERIRQRHEAIEKRFNELFSRLGENIHRLSQDIVHYTSSMMEEVDEQKLEDKLKRVVKTETQILDATANLLDFLRLKAKKVAIKKDLFDLNGVLDDVNESLLCQIGKTETELIFDIDPGLPRNIIGDFVHIGEVLSSLLENALLQSEGDEVTMEVLAYKPYNGKMELQFKVSYFCRPEVENPEEFFIPVYEEKSGEYRRLGCFIAHELTQMMEGEISVHYAGGGRQTIIDLTIPVEEPEKTDQRKYHLNHREYIQKEVLIVNRSYNASLALKKMFSYFRHRVRIMDAESFERKRPPLKRYDIVVIDETLINDLFVDYIRDLLRHRNIKVVGLSNLFSGEKVSPHEDIFAARLTKPLNMERVYSMINEIYGIEETEYGTEETRKAPVKVFWANIPERPHTGLEDFRDFNGAGRETGKRRWRR